MVQLSQQARTDLQHGFANSRTGVEITEILNRLENVGNTYYVDSAGSDSNSGLQSDAAFATVAKAISTTTASNGDIIYILPGHSETITTAIAMSKIGVALIGLGRGTLRPQFTGNVAADTITVTAADCEIRNLQFNEATSVTGGAINVAGANLRIAGCRFDLGANDLEAITVETAGDNLTVENCEFKVTANGPDAAIELEGTSSDLVVRRCLFDGGSDTNAWDAAAINSTNANTGILIDNNTFLFVLTAQEWITLTAITEPAVITDSNTFNTGAGVATYKNVPQTFYVDSNKGNDVAGAGTSWHTPCATIDYAIVTLCTAGAGDTVEVAAGHAETIAANADLDVDKDDITIRGLGRGTAIPRLTFNGDIGATINISGANCTLENLWMFCSQASGITAAITGTATCDGLYLKDIIFEEDLVTTEIIIAVSIAAAAHDIRIDGMKFHGILGGGDLSCIDFVGASDRSVVENCYFHGDWSASVIDGLAAASVGILYRNIIFYQDDANAGLGIDEHDSSTGLMDSCRWLNKKDTVEGLTGDLMAYNQCYGTNAVNVQGILEPVADT